MSRVSQGLTPGLYADNSQILPHQITLTIELADMLNSDLENVSKWLPDNKLHEYHTTKCKPI